MPICLGRPTALHCQIHCEFLITGIILVQACNCSNVSKHIYGAFRTFHKTCLQVDPFNQERTQLSVRWCVKNLGSLDIWQLPAQSLPLWRVGENWSEILIIVEENLVKLSANDFASKMYSDICVVLSKILFLFDNFKIIWRSSASCTDHLELLKNFCHC